MDLFKTGSKQGPSIVFGSWTFKASLSLFKKFICLLVCPAPRILVPQPGIEPVLSALQGGL